MLQQAVHRAVILLSVRVKLVCQKLPVPIRIGAVIVVCLVCVGSFQNYRADGMLHIAQKSDNSGSYSQAQKELRSINQFAVLPSIRKEIQLEQQRNKRLLVAGQKLREVQQLLKEHKTKAAEQLLKSVSSQTGNLSPGLQAQVTQIQKTVVKQTTGKSSGHSGSSASSSGASTGKPGGSKGGGGSPGGGSGGSGGSGGGGSSGGGSNGPMTAITINSFSTSVSARNASMCNMYESVNFSVNGSGSVQVTWEEFSARTSSALDNPATYTFSTAGSKTDTPGNFGIQGLEPGDSYRVSVTITDKSNPSITTTAGPMTFSSCAASQSLQSPGQQSFMTHAVTSTNLSVSQSQDSLFSNECSMNLQSSFSVNGPGSVQVVYAITSAYSIGATLYSSQQEDFTGSGSSSDSSYIRMPHLPGGGNYTVTAKFNVLGDPSHDATSGPITAACS